MVTASSDEATVEEDDASTGSDAPEAMVDLGREISNALHSLFN